MHPYIVCGLDESKYQIKNLIEENRSFLRHNRNIFKIFLSNKRADLLLKGTILVIRGKS